MFKLKNKKHILFFALILLSSSCQSNSLKNNNPINNKVQTFMNNLINDDRVPGAVFAVAKKNKILYTQAFGVSNVDTQKKVTTDTIFHIGSTHKAMTSLLVAILVDEGVLTWDTKAQDIYEDFTLSNESYASQITIRQLLDMSSGLPGDFDNPPSEARGLLEDLINIPLKAPQTQYKYSNLSVSIAGYLAVLAHKKFDNGFITEGDLDNLHDDYEELLNEKILIPIGMTDSYLYIDEARETNRMSKSHYLKNDAFMVSKSVDKPIDVLAPSGGLKSTVKDMMRYMIVEAQQGTTAQGKRIVSQKNMIERQTLSYGISGEEEYGLCLEVKTLDNGMKYVGIAGSFDDFNSAIGFFPKQKISFVLLTNGDSEDVLDLTGDEIENQMAQWVNQF